VFRRVVPALLLAGCVPNTPSPLGEPCDGTHPCPDQTFCQANLCAAALDAGARNLLPNPGFESPSGVTFGWSAFGFGSSLLSGQSVFIRSGAQAGRVDLDAGPGTGAGDLFGAESGGSQMVTAPETGSYCGTAWVLSGAVAPPAISPDSVKLAMVRNTPDGGRFNATPDSGILLPTDAGWAQVSNVFQAEVNDSIGVRVLGIGAGKTSAFLMDDAALWFSPDGGCTDGP